MWHFSVLWFQVPFLREIVKGEIPGTHINRLGITKIKKLIDKEKDETLYSKS